MQSCHVCHQQSACNEEESIYGYWQLQEVKFRFSPESGYTIGLILSETYSCFRPEVVVQIISSNLNYGQPFLSGNWRLRKGSFMLH